MDIGRILVFIPLATYFLYLFWKSKKDIYLVFGSLSWVCAIYSGKLNAYQILQDPIKSIINMITAYLLLLMFTLYFKKSIKEFK